MMIRLLAVLLLFAAGPVLAQAPSPAQREAFDAAIRDYLLRNPEVVVEALQAFETKQKLEQAAQQRAAIAALQDELARDPDSHVAGNPAGDVTVVEFFDYRCSYCKRAKPEVAELLRRDGKVRLVLKEFPILGPDSVVASRIAIATLLTQRDRYPKLHQLLMDSRGTLEEAATLQIAAEAGVDVTRLKQSLADPRIDRTLAANRALAQRLGIEGTPAFVIGNALVPGAVPADRLLDLVAAARAESARR